MPSHRLHPPRSISLPAAATVLFSAVALGHGAVDRASAAPPPPPVPCVQNVCLIVVDLSADSDGDGFTDADELAYGSDPKDAGSHPPVLDVVYGVFNGTTPSFTDHATELVVIPLVDPAGNRIETGLGDFMIPRDSKEQRIGLTFDTFGLDLAGMRVDASQSLITEGSSKPGGRFSLIAAGGKSGPDSTQMTVGKNGDTTGTVVSTDSSGQTTQTTIATSSDGGKRHSTQTAQGATVGPDGEITPSGPTTETTVTVYPTDDDGNTVTDRSTDVKGADDGSSSLLQTHTVEHQDGSSTVMVFEAVTHSDGTSTITTGQVIRDASGKITEATWTQTEVGKDGGVTKETSGSCKDACYWDPDLEQAMGWASPLTVADWQRVAKKMGSTIHTVEGWTPPPVGGPILTTTPKGPLVALLDSESALTVISAGAPTFTSVSPDYDPRLQELVGAVTSSGQLPPDTSPYTHEP